MNDVPAECEGIAGELADAEDELADAHEQMTEARSTSSFLLTGILGS